MKKRYRVKLNEGHKAIPSQQWNGYLGSGRIATYTRGEAIKKANAFGGEIEDAKPSFIIEDLKMAEIRESNLIHGVDKELRGREMFVDVDSDFSDRIYSGDVFDTILGEDSEAKRMRYHKGLNLDKKALAQLEELSEALSKYHFVRITNF